MMTIHIFYPNDPIAVYHWDISSEQSIDKVLEEARIDYPRARRFTIHVDNNPYENWNMQGEKLKWYVTYEINAPHLAAWYCK